MGNTYAKAILRGTRKLSEVPQTWHAVTIETLQEMRDPEHLEQLLEEEKAD